jgi:outer membrane receptor for ferrienterochelin and colicins
MKKYFILFLLYIPFCGESQLMSADSLEVEEKRIDDVIIIGNSKKRLKKNSIIPINVKDVKDLQKNPVPNLFEFIGMINGVSSQIDCSVCNTGSIHINGMDGPYTLVLIDGMPIVSSLSSVYGLNGIPNSIIDRIEVTKGSGGALYDSEAMGGMINVITKNPLAAPLVSADIFASNWRDINTDLSVKLHVGKNVTGLLGINYFNFNHRIDKNKDNFTDMTLQNRISVFNKWRFQRKENRIGSMALRYVYEDRWGGQMNWNKEWRGSDSIYGESIYTKRFEIIGTYQLPLKEKIFTQYSFNFHEQRSWYGNTSYNAEQKTVFFQTYWNKKWWEKHNFMLGATFKYIYYDDNTPGTETLNGENAPSQTPLPGFFVQDEWSFNKKSILLLGYRYNYDKNHGGIHSPRVAYKFSPDKNSSFRVSTGTGFRVVNLFTEDHAALTGAREVIITENLKPEKSINTNVNYTHSFISNIFWGSLELTGFYSYFTNKIIGDFNTDQTKIIYDNLDGYAVSKGISVDVDFNFTFPLNIELGVTYMDVFSKNRTNENFLKKEHQLYAPKWSGNFTVGYKFKNNWSLDFTGEWKGSMKLPVQENDFRPEYSPLFCLANTQLTKKFKNGWELYGGFKNIFDFTPKNTIMRPDDPFNKKADNLITNPYGYTFDTAYNYASLQGFRTFMGLRITIK